MTRFESHLKTPLPPDDSRHSEPAAFIAGLIISLLLLFYYRSCEMRQPLPLLPEKKALPEVKKPVPVKPPVRKPITPPPPVEKPKVIRSGIFFVYEVRQGDTPRSISRKFLGVSGRYALIRDAATNRALGVNTPLKEGMQLIVPAAD